jgi:fatty-acyl-CoA synthase
MSKHYDTGLDKNAANYAALSPLPFLEWAAQAAPAHPSIIHGDRRFTWGETYARCRQLASALIKHGVGKGDTVAVMLANTPEMYECHFGVPMTGAVLNCLNTRLDAAAIAFILDHGEAKVVLTDREFSPTMSAALERAKVQPLIVDVDDREYKGSGTSLGSIEYETLLSHGDPQFAWKLPDDEWNAIALNYTSGTTGDPKGVVFHHRGAYLAALGNNVVWGMPRSPVYLWTLPMFHCNGWCFPWALAAVAATNVCLRKVEAAAIFDAIRKHKVTHFCGAPIVHNTILNAPAELRRGIEHKVRAFVAGAAPPAATLAAAESAGIEITHVYGLTEVYGPATVCVKHDEWEALDPAERARLNGRQGIRYPSCEAATVMDPETMQEVPADGETMGEIMFRGNMTMKGYLKNEKATRAAFAGGWFHSGDLAVLHPDGYMKVKDRSKDIIISGGENISSLEVEDALYHHPAVLAVGVVARPDPKWGEAPCAYVELKDGASVTEEELVAHCRARMAGFKIPKSFVFGPLPKTSTGKIQKFVLRDRAKSASAIE